MSMTAVSLLRRPVLARVVALIALSPVGGTTWRPAAHRMAPLVDAALGDALSAGAGADDPLTQSYPALLARHLPRGAHVLNLGSSGASLDLDRTIELPLALEAHATVVTLWVGANVDDFKVVTPRTVGAAAASYRTELERMLTIVQARHVQLFAANEPSVLIASSVSSRTDRADADIINRAIAAVAARHGAAVIDVGAVEQVLWGVRPLPPMTSIAPPRAIGRWPSCFTVSCSATMCSSGGDVTMPLPPPHPLSMRAVLSALVAALLLLVLRAGAVRGQPHGALVQALRLPTVPTALILDEATDRAVVTADNATLSVVDLAHGRLVRTVALDRGAADPSLPLALAVQTHRLFVAHSRDASTRSPAFVLDNRSGALLTTVPVGVDASAVAVDSRQGHVFVANSGDETVSMLNARSGALMRTTAVRLAAGALAVEAATARLFVIGGGRLGPGSSYTSDRGLLSLLDTRSGALLRTLTVGHAPRALAVDARTARLRGQP